MSSNRLQTLHTFLDEDAPDPFILFAIAKEHEKLNQLDKALEYYLNLKEHHTNYVGTYYHLGKLYEKLEQFQNAFFTYKDGMKVAKAEGDQHSLSELAGAKLSLGDDDDFE